MSEKTFTTYEKNDLDILQTLLKNIVKMLSRRVYFENGVKNTLVNIKKEIKPTDNNIYEFDCNNGKKICVKIISQKISSINKINAVNDVLTNYKEHHKIFIFKEFAKRVKAQLKGSELFREDELMVDVLDYIYQPKFELLSANEKKELLASYKLKLFQLPRIKTFDPVAKYLNLKNGDVVRVIMPSDITGEKIEYAVIL